MGIDWEQVRINQQIVERERRDRESVQGIGTCKRLMLASRRGTIGAVWSRRRPFLNGAKSGPAHRPYFWGDLGVGTRQGDRRGRKPYPIRLDPRSALRGPQGRF